MKISDSRDVEALQQRVVELETVLQGAQQENASLQAELARLQHVEAANLAKSIFLVNMSRELRTSLSAILDYAEALEARVEDSRFETMIPGLRKVQTICRRLLTLSDAVLDLSRIEAGHMEVTLETFDADALIADVVKAVEPLMDQQHNTLSVRREADLGEMYADRAKVRHVLVNLLRHAAKFTAEGTVTLTTARAQGVDGDVAIFSVADTGIGLRPAQIQKLFIPFAQVDVSAGGTGLGLTISHRFCEMLGGTLTVESEPGEGSVFTARLPLHVPERVAAIPSLVETQVAGAPTPEGGVAEEEVTVVLVVDDDPAAQELITHFLNKEGFHTVTASSGPEGLRMARDLHPDVITLDVMMPEMDGWTVLSDIKSDPKLMDIPVVILTILDKKQMGFALGASDYLTKPIDREHLLRTLRRYERESTAKALKEAYVLVVEDDDSARRMLRRTLQLAAWKVMEAADGYEALEKVAEQEPALILLDLMMPKMDGFTFIAELRKNPEWRDIPIVVITAKDLDKGEQARLKGTVEQILQKGGYRREELLREVRDHIFTQMHYRTV